MSALGETGHVSGVREGHKFFADIVPPSLFQFVEADILVSSAQGHPYVDSEWRVFVRGFDGCDPESIWEIYSDGPVETMGFQPLTVISAELYANCKPADPSVTASSEPFEPSSDALEAVPADRRFSDSPHVQNFTVKDRRFSRLTPDGVAAAQVAAEAAKALAARAKQEEDERLAQEARKNDKQAACEAWLDSLPAGFEPGRCKLDIQKEINPRRGQVEYDNVKLRDDGLFDFFCSSSQLPTRGKITFGYGRTDDQIFHLHHVTPAWLDRFVSYEGSAQPLGTRVPRAEALNGSNDPFPPRWGDCMIAHITYVGKEFSSDTGDDFTVGAALEFLAEKSPDSMVTVSVEDEDDESDNDYEADDDGGEPRRQVTRQRVSQSLAERYRHLFDHLGRPCYGLNVRWTEYEWGSHDRKLLAAEERRRLDSNAAWSKRKSGLIHFMNLLGASSEDDSNEFWEGATSVLALPEAELDRLETFLRHVCNCKLVLSTGLDEPEPGFVERHSVTPGRLDELLAHWKKCNGSIPRFMGATLHLARDSGAIQFPVEGLIQEGMVTLFAGPAKLGKSTLALNLAMCFAAGQPFGGLSVKRGEAAYFFGEGSKATFRAQLVAAGISNGELEIIDARDYDADLEKALDLALEDLKKSLGLGLLIMDSAEAFVVNATDGTAVTRIFNKLDAFSAQTGVPVLLLHHGTKDLTADNATSAKAVFDKIKGAGTFVNRSRAVITLHRDGNYRVMTLHKDNIPEFTPKLRSALKFEIDPKTGLCSNVSAPIVAIGSIPAPLPPAAEGAASAVSDADAIIIAPIIHRLEMFLGKPPPFAGPKSPFSAKAAELDGWSRLRCERAHRRAVELKLCKAAVSKKRSLKPRR